MPLRAQQALAHIGTLLMSKREGIEHSRGRRCSGFRTDCTVCIGGFIRSYGLSLTGGRHNPASAGAAHPHSIVVSVHVERRVYGRARWWALSSPDQVRVTVTQVMGGPYQVVYQHTFDRTVAAKVEDILNHQLKVSTFTLFPWSPPGEIVTHPPTGNHPEWQYHLDFLWHGLTLETATTTDAFVPESVGICELGLCDLRARLTITRDHQVFSFIHELVAISGGVIPTSPGYGQS